MQFDQLKRRNFIALLGGAAAWPLAARAQQAGKISRVGFLANDPNIPAQPAGRAFLEGLRESGFIEGKNVIVERRFAEGRIEQYAALVSERRRLASIARRSRQAAVPPAPSPATIGSAVPANTIGSVWLSRCTAKSP
jgi:hypothetical protein